MIGGAFFLLFVLLAILGFLFWVWMLIDCATKESDQGNTKLVWVIIIVFTNVIGALIYFFVQRPQRLQRFYNEAHSSRNENRPL